MFKKVLGTLTNVRPSKSETAELTTTPTNGNIKINSIAAQKIGVVAEDLLTIVPAEEEDGTISLYLAKGTKGDKENGVPQVGAVLSSPSGKLGGSLQMSSENAWRELGGNNDNKKIYDVADGFDFEGKSYFKLTLKGEEAKVDRKKATKE